MMSDADLLRSYAESRAEDAFAELVRRHLNMVYGVALRRTGGNAPLAEEVTQNVFTDLARKAATVSRHQALAGWLYTSTRLASARAIRTEVRRQSREEKAEFMPDDLHPPATELDWQRLQPQLDDVLDTLADADRKAVILRFYAAKPYAEIASALNLSEDAARRRVDRALDKLRLLLSRRGITSTSAALSLALTGNATIVAPAGLAAGISQSILTVAGGGSALLLFMSSITLKTGVVTAVMLAGAAGLYWQHRENSRLQTENERLRVEAAARPQRDVPREEEITRLNAMLATEVQAIEGDQPYEDSLAIWIGQVRKLGTFLERHPELGIPEIALVSEADWLDATKGVTFEVEADYRKALAALRRIARNKSQAAISTALQQAIAANDGAPPESVEDLARHLPPGFDHSILQRFTLDPSGEIPELRVSGAPFRFILTEKPLDPLWDTQFFFAKGGATGVGVVGGMANSIEKAMDEFTRVTGALPYQATQLLPYIDPRTKVEPDVLDEYFRALTTKLDL